VDLAVLTIKLNYKFKALSLSLSIYIYLVTVIGGPAVSHSPGAHCSLHAALDMGGSQDVAMQLWVIRVC